MEDYLFDSDDDADTTSSAIDAFEKRLAAVGDARAAPVKKASGAAKRAQTKPIPQHL